ncbi:hypothetical protein [Microbacterium sp.]|uniref:hypothetical protein n=1 Tax=Microbacterium sp. TaxID=51671 RepID=UPI003A88D801
MSIARRYEAARVLLPGGRIGIANWAESRHNDIETVEAALIGPSKTVDEDYRCEGGLERLLVNAGITVIASGLTPVNWRVPRR